MALSCYFFIDAFLCNQFASYKKKLLLWERVLILISLDIDWLTNFQGSFIENVITAWAIVTCSYWILSAMRLPPSSLLSAHHQAN